jgi:hypothetical protein
VNTRIAGPRGLSLIPIWIPAFIIFAACATATTPATVADGGQLDASPNSSDPACDLDAGTCDTQSSTCCVRRAIRVDLAANCRHGYTIFACTRRPSPCLTTPAEGCYQRTLADGTTETYHTTENSLSAPEFADCSSAIANQVRNIQKMCQ